MQFWFWISSCLIWQSTRFRCSVLCFKFIPVFNNLQSYTLSLLKDNKSVSPYLRYNKKPCYRIKLNPCIVRLIICLSIVFVIKTSPWENYCKKNYANLDSEFWLYDSDTEEKYIKWELLKLIQYMSVYIQHLSMI